MDWKGKCCKRKNLAFLQHLVSELRSIQREEITEKARRSKVIVIISEYSSPSQMCWGFCAVVGRSKIDARTRWSLHHVRITPNWLNCSIVSWNLTCNLCACVCMWEGVSSPCLNLLTKVSVMFQGSLWCIDI